ncbi:DUF6968 family protein [Myxococcus landrumensis]|uniref:DUF6968 domain-containing protein n=1 Tax=Myxococcus landrumensis TaxID=2813577 RepID=A0ABX7N1H7_9BACT|nr:hypothetical protein [Myxococcus landrumus]QSQ11545.1 hypothetical protein JY572_24425 [Myxococcus landrumus]
MRPLIASRRYKWTDQPGWITARLFTPFRSGSSYKCQFSIQGIGRSKIEGYAKGTDSFQAVMMAFEGLRVFLLPIADKVTFDGILGSDISRPIPSSYGPEKEAHFIALIERELDRMLRSHGEDPKPMQARDRERLLARREELLELRKEKKPSRKTKPHH